MTVQEILMVAESITGAFEHGQSLGLPVALAGMSVKREVFDQLPGTASHLTWSDERGARECWVKSLDCLAVFCYEPAQQATKRPPRSKRKARLRPA